jgi:deoxyribose-phosphate aldolase
MFLSSLKIIKSNKIYQDMRLTHLAIIVIRGSKDMVKHLAEALDVSIPTIYKYIRDNDDALTKAAALKVIREETGLNDEQLLDSQTAETA